MNKMMLKKQYMMYAPKKKGRLPSDYQEVEYIQGTGTQYINTLVIPTSKTGWEIEFEQEEKKDIWYFGVDTGWETNGFGFNVHKKYGTTDIYPLLYINSSDLYEDFETIQANQRYVVKYGNGLLRVNNTEYSVPSFTGNLTIPIYTHCINRNNIAGDTSQGTGKIYSLKFYENNTIIRDFIPCYRKSDNEVGLYDIVNNQFYTNQGTGTFLCGRPLVYDTIQGYQQVDYIETTGTQWIDTNYIPTIDDVIETDIEFNSIAIKSVENWLSVFGADPTKSLWIYKETNKVPTYFCTYSGGSAVEKIMQVSTNVPYNIIFKSNTFIVNGTSYSISKGTSTSQDTLSLFRVNPYSASSYPCFDGKLRTFRVYKNNEYLINLIPMRRLSDNELGLYDLVNGVFYTNQGSGKFIAGEVLKA